jgi:hypothetical protein
VFRQDRTNPSSAVSNWKGRKDTPKAWVSTAVSSWLNGGLFGGGIDLSGKAGYFLGGYGTGAPQSIEQWTFPADVGTLLGITLGQDSRNGAGFSNDGVAGYNGVGQGGGTDYFVTTVDKLTYATGALGALGTGLSAAANGLSAMSNVAVAGYVSQGNQSNTYVTTVDKFAYSGDSRTTLSSGLSSTRSYGMAFANSGTAGYIGGGYSYSGGYTFYTTVDKWAFSDDSRSTLGTGILSTQSFSPAGMANSGTAGYCLGGGTAVGTDTDSVTKFAFSDDSRTTLGTGLSAEAYYCAAMADSGVAGYNALSQSNGSGTDVMNKFAFSDDSRSTLATVVERNLVPSAFANCSALSP